MSLVVLVVALVVLADEELYLFFDENVIFIVFWKSDSENRDSKKRIGDWHLGVGQWYLGV